METIDVYSAVVIQPEIKMATRRKQISENLDRYIELLETTYFVGWRF